MKSIKENSINLMIQKLQSQLDNLFSEQQALNGDKGGGMMRNGGLAKADNGWEIPEYLDPNTLAYGQNDFNYQPLMNAGINWFNSQNQPKELGNVNVTADINKPFNNIQGDTTSAVAASQVAPNGAKTATGYTGGKPTWGGNLGSMNQHVASFNTQVGPAKTEFGKANPINNTLAKAPDTTSVAGTGPNWGKIGSLSAQLSGPLYNMFKGLQKSDKAVPNYNPYEGEARTAMRNRRYNIDPQLNANMTAQAVSNRNIKNLGNSRGEMMSNLGASQNYRMAGDAAAWAQKNNMDNQYLGEQAQMDANLGQQRSQMDWMTQDANARNKAATNQFLGQGFHDFGMFGQTQQLMANQATTDNQRLGIYDDAFGGEGGGIMQWQKNISEMINSRKKE